MRATPGRSQGPWTRVVRDAAMVLSAGVLVAAVANALSPRGLSWTRDYFPAAPVPDGARSLPTPGNAVAAPSNGAPGTAVPVPSTTVHAGPTSVPTASDPVIDRLRQRGLAVVGFDEVVRHFEDPRREEERVLFVDARKDERFQEGHIPGAYQLDHYYPDRYLPELLPACQLAEVIVVYCTGGACEDSEYAALLLKEAGIPAERLFVYPGGIDEWRKRRRVVEVAARRSGDLEPAP